MKISGKKIAILVSCALVVIAAIVVLCVILIPKGSANITLKVDDIVVVQGESKEIEFECSDSDAKITFEIDESDIAKVEEGKVFGLKVGTAKLRVIAEHDNNRAVCVASVSVVEDASQQIVDLPSEITLYLIDKEFELAEADGYHNKIAFENFRPYVVNIVNKVVSVKDNTICAEKVGSTDIIFTSSLGDTYTVKATVLGIEPTISVSDEIEMLAKESCEIHYTISPAYYTGPEPVITFSSNPNLVSFVGNTMTANHSGSCSVDLLMDGEKAATISVKIKMLFTYEIDTSRADSNCKFEGGVLKVLRGTSAKFSVTIKTLDGQTLGSQLWRIRTEIPNGRDLNFITLTPANDSELEIYSDTLASNVVIQVQVVDSL